MSWTVVVGVTTELYEGSTSPGRTREDRTDARRVTGGEADVDEHLEELGSTVDDPAADRPPLGRLGRRQRQAESLCDTQGEGVRQRRAVIGAVRLGRDHVAEGQDERGESGPMQLKLCSDEQVCTLIHWPTTYPAVHDDTLVGQLAELLEAVS
jgi:hypothetical protein